MKEMESFFREQYPGLYRLALRFLQNPEDASDLIQDAYILVQKEQTRQNIMQMENPRAWLYRITTNLCLNHIKKNRRIRDLLTMNFQQMLHRKHQSTHHQNPEEIALMEEGKTRFAQAYQALSPKNRLLLDLFHSGLNYEEIALAMNITRESVGNKLYRVRTRLSHALDPKGVNP